MEKTMKPPGRKKGQKREQPAEPVDKDKRSERDQPAAAERTDDRETAEPVVEAGSPSREEVISNVTKPVTNQDEQDKITNAGSDDIPVPDK